MVGKTGDMAIEQCSKFCVTFTDNGVAKHLGSKHCSEGDNCVKIAIVDLNDVAK